VGAQFDTLRRQYANFKTIENSMRNVDATVGNVSPRALRQAVDTANRRGASRDMTETANALAKVIGDKLGQSGTQPRSYWEKAATLGGIGGSTYGLTQSPGMALASVLAAPSLQVILENPATRAWAANRLASHVPTLPSGELAAKLAAIQGLVARDPSALRGPQPTPIGAGR
jgi:hypothetical protein